MTSIIRHALFGGSALQLKKAKTLKEPVGVVLPTLFLLGRKQPLLFPYFLCELKKENKEENIMGKTIRSTLTGEVVAVLISEERCLRGFIEDMLTLDDAFLVTDENGTEGDKEPVAELVAYDNCGQEGKPELAAVFVGNLDDADLLAGRFNLMPFADYFMMRRPAGFCAGIKGGAANA